MFWADRILGEIEKRFDPEIKAGKPILIRDEKTVSGRVHIGSMRGVAIHGVIAEALKEKGVPHKFLYELNDFDVFDSVPPELEAEKFEQYLGMLLMNVPSPESRFPNFAHYYGDEFRKVIEGTGFNPEFYWGSEVYLSGRMDDAIREALLHAEDIKRIYKEVSGGERNESWLPLHVLCPQCKKISTTEASGFDGETVMVHCKVDKAPYTK